MFLRNLLLVTTLMVCCNGYKIFVVFPMASKSHSILGDGIVDALAKAGHEITYLTPFPKNKGPSNVREIELSENTKILPENIGDIKQYMGKGNKALNFTRFFDGLKRKYIATVQNNDVQKIMLDPNEKFDVVIAEWLFFEFIAGFAAVFNCPYIWLSSADPHRNILQLVDAPPNPAYNPDIISSNMPPFTFYQRAQELLFFVGGLLFSYFKTDGIQYNEYNRLFSEAAAKRGHPLPPYEEFKYNASLVLSNSHVSIGKSLPLPQNFKPIGGYHINRDVKPLPEDLKKLLDGANNGLIYFSMGSNLKSKFMPEELKQSLLKMFGGLKYTVLWKFEEELPGTPKNVHIVQWAPQQSILAHPNCILFITHGGQLSTTETIHFGKPIIAIPAFADQYLNADRAVKLGFAKKVDLSYTMADDIKIAIQEVLGDPKYSTRVKELSAIYHDRTMTPDKELVFWVEHVIKTRGAPHLRSPALAVPFYQKLYLDLAALVGAVIFCIIAVLKRIVTYFRSCKRKAEKKKQ